MFLGKALKIQNDPVGLDWPAGLFSLLKILSPVLHLLLWNTIFERRIIMGIDKKLVKLWKESREDVVTTLKVLRKLDIIKEQDATFLTEKLDIAVRASNT